MYSETEKDSDKETNTERGSERARGEREREKERERGRADGQRRIDVSLACVFSHMTGDRGTFSRWGLGLYALFWKN